PLLELPGYRINYSKKRWLFPLTIISQIPKIISAIKQEHQWLLRVAELYSVDLIISDNRYGLYHPKIHSVFITHQLHIKTPFGKGADRMLQKLNYRFINRFSECWIPDYPGKINLAGILSHPFHKPSIPVNYIGPLSRFQFRTGTKMKNRLLIILSGPEPQRTLFEKILLA